MYDTCNFRLDLGDISDGKPFGILPYLSDVSERQNEKHGYSCSGKLDSYDVHVFQWGIYMNGSLAKFSMDGDNTGRMYRRTTQDAIEKISDLLHTDFGLARVTRVDVAAVFPTNRPPSDYFNYLGNKPHFTRVQATPDTLYYQNHQRVLCFYDKAKEQKEMPVFLQGSNVLRYELRFMRRVDKQLKAEVTAKLLHDKHFYTSMVHRWRDEFLDVHKIKKQSVMTDNIVTIKDAESALFAHLLQQSGQSTIDEFLNDLKAANVFKERPRYSELKRRLHSILETRKGQENELVKELENDVWNWSAYAR